MAFDYQKFRERYRSDISPSYNGWLHMLVVAITGITVIAYSLSQVAAPEVSELLVVPLTLIAVNFAEYAAHRWMGHRKGKNRLARLFYSRHSGDHHSFFVGAAMPAESVRDWRVVLFPAYLIFAFLIGLIIPLGGLLVYFDQHNIAYLYAASGIFGYLLYEVMHFSYHLPKGSFVERTPGWKHLRRLHLLHHDRSRMARKNFNITLPVFDVLLNTLYWKPEDTEISSEKTSS